MTAGAALIIVATVALAYGIVVGTTPAPLFSTIAAGRTLSASSAVFLGLGTSLAMVGMAYEMAARDRWGGIRPVGLAAAPVGLALSVWGFIMSAAAVCPGVGIDYMGPGGLVAQRCLVPISPFPVAAVGVAFLGGLVSGMVALPRWRIAPSTPPQADPERGR